MKYIRTKDGEIIKINKNVTEDSIWSCKYEIDKLADTIEELCDEFVSILYGRPNICCLSTARFNCEKFDVFGAVWTDKGLIYVAKMNEKGELELI